MTTATTTITGSTPQEIDRSYKEAFIAATPKGAKQPPRDVLASLLEQQRKAQEALAAAAKTKSNGTSTPRAPKSPEGFVICKDGKALSRNSLSFAAWAATKGIGGAKVERIGTVELRTLLAKLGVKDPETTSWSVTLPNGVALAGVLPGDPLPAAPAGAAKKTTASKAASKKATSTTAGVKPKEVAKSSRARKAAKASKAAAKKSVTPRPKKATSAARKAS